MTLTKKFSYGWALALLTAVWLLQGVLFWGMESGDETRVAGIVAEMVQRNEWLVPRLNGTPFLEYPPMYYWWSGLFIRLFGQREWAAALASVLAAAGSVYLVWKMVLRLGGTEKMAAAAGFILLGSAQFLAESRTVRVDILLAFFITAAYYGFFCMMRPGGIPPARRDAAKGAIVLALGVCGGVLTKGLIGAVLPAAGMGTYLVLDDVLSGKWRWRRYVAVGAAFGAAMLPVVLWGLLLYRDQGAGAVYTVAIVNNFGRFTGSQGAHASPVYAYLQKLPTTFLPFIVLVFVGLWSLIRRIFQERDRRALAICLYLLMPYCMLTLASAKRMVYLLPLAPAAALVALGGCLYLLTVFPRFGAWAAKVKPAVLFAVLLVLGIVVQTGMAAVRHVRAPQDTVRDFWARVDSVSRRENRPVVLIDAPERTRGAAVFYLGHTVATRGMTDPLSGARELLVLRRRDKEKGNRNADWHRMLRMPEETAEFRALCR